MQEQTRFSLGEARELMAERNIDVLIASSPENVYYTTGCAIITQRFIPSRLELAVLPRDSDPMFIVATIEQPQAEQESSIQDIVGYTELQQSPIHILADLLRQRGLERSCAAIENSHLVMGYSEELHNEIPGARFVDAVPLFDHMRRIKSVEEQRALAQAAVRTLASIEVACLQTRAGDTEKQLARRVAHALMDNGAIGVEFLIVAGGGRSSISHPFPTDFPLEPGTPVRFDIGARFGQYCADIGQTAFVGEPGDELLSSFERLAALLSDLFDHIRPGVKTSEVFQLYMRKLDEYGLYVDPGWAHMGHSIGLSVHELPMMAPLSEERFEEGMVMNIEPACHIGNYWYCIEDCFRVTADGVEVFTKGTIPRPIIIKA